MFECKMCGMCCRNIQRYKEKILPILREILGEDITEFNIKDNNGICVHLTNDNKCSIYENRPIICNTNKIFELLSTAIGVDKSELYKAQHISCRINRNNINH